MRHSIASLRPIGALHGYILGGVLDDVADLLSIAHTRAIVVGGYAVGR